MSIILACLVLCHLSCLKRTEFIVLVKILEVLPEGLLCQVPISRQGTMCSPLADSIFPDVFVFALCEGAPFSHPKSSCSMRSLALMRAYANERALKLLLLLKWY